MRILIAEDETIIRLDLRDLLERAGHEVVAEARDGEEAVALAREHAPELAVLRLRAHLEARLLEELTEIEPDDRLVLSDQDLHRRPFQFVPGT